MFPILTYHYLGVPGAEVEERHRGLYVPPGEFRAQLASLTALGYRSLSADEAPGASGRVIWLTFDDGHRDNFDPGLRLLTEAGHRATFFVTVEPCLAGRPGFMDLSMMRQLLAAGMSIGSHSLTHPRLARLSASELQREVVDSKARLEDALGIAVTTFCYPFGNWNAAVVDTVRAAGYACAVTTIRGNRNPAGERFLLKRAMVQPGRVGIRFRYMLSPLYDVLHSFKNRGKWAAKPT